MTTSRRLASLTLAAGLTLATTLALPPAAQARASTAGSCTELGKIKKRIVNKKFVWDIAQKDREENYTGHAENIEFEVQRSSTRTNSVSISASAKVSGDAWFASFEASVGTEMGHVNEKFAFSSTKRTYHLSTGDIYYFGRGSGRWTATGIAYKCMKINAHDDGRAYFETARGPIKGYTGLTHSVVGCKQKVKSTSMAAVLKRSC